MSEITYDYVTSVKSHYRGKLFTNMKNAMHDDLIEAANIVRGADVSQIVEAAQSHTGGVWVALKFIADFQDTAKYAPDNEPAK